MAKALALRYRPKKFSDLIGQEHISQTIRSGLKNDKLSHAYLFSGLRGSGKTSTARIFAKTLVCENKKIDEPCGECNACLSAEEGRHLDIIEMDAASNRGIEDIRQLIESAKYKPASAKYKIYIIDEVHMLSTPAFNALLKTLEEPPSYVKFILATTDPIKLPPTILSRTIHFRFKKIALPDVVEHLVRVVDKEGVSFEEEALEMIARNGNGSLRDTLTLLDQAIAFCDSHLSKDKIAELLGAVNPDEIAKLMFAILSKDREKALSFVKEFCAYEAESVLTEIVEFLKASFLYKNRPIPLYALDRFFRAVAEAKELLFMGADGDFTLTLTFLKMLEAMEIEEIDALILRYEGEAEPKAALRDEHYDGANRNLSRDSAVLSKKQTRQDDDKWGKLIEALYNRNYDIGKVFEENVKFISFDGAVLTWESAATDKERELLKKYYSQIKFLTQEVYGATVSIAVRKQDEQPRDDDLPINVDIPAQKREEEERGLEKSADEEALELNLLKHPLVIKTRETFDVKEVDVKVLQKV